MLRVMELTDVFVFIFLLIFVMIRANFIIKSKKHKIRKETRVPYAHVVAATGTTLLILLGFILSIFHETEPLTRFQLVTLTMEFSLSIGLLLIFLGVTLFYLSHRALGTLFSVEVQLKHGHKLISSGPYSYIRNPLYTSTFLIIGGLIIIYMNTLLLIPLTMGIYGFYTMAKKEELMLEIAFQGEYLSYKKRTGMFLPKLGSRE